MKPMRTLILSTTAGVVALALAIGLSAQQPRKSPHETASIEVGGHKITLTYGRPYLHGRKMLGDHEPYGKVWRTGADEATTLETDADLDINGLKVPKGKYALFTLFTEKSWTLIVSKKADQWGAFSYNQADDLGRVEMSVSKPAQPIEQLTITLSPDSSNGATLKLAWETTEASVPIKVGP